MSLSLSLTQMNAQNIFSLKEFFLKLFFMNERLYIYTLLNRHIVLEITVVYRLTNSKYKKINIIIIIIIIIWTRGPSPHMPKVQPNVQLMSI